MKWKKSVGIWGSLRLLMDDNCRKFRALFFRANCLIFDVGITQLSSTTLTSISARGHDKVRASLEGDNFPVALTRRAFVCHLCTRTRMSCRRCNRYLNTRLISSSIVVRCCPWTGSECPSASSELSSATSKTLAQRLSLFSRSSLINFRLCFFFRGNFHFYFASARRCCSLDFTFTTDWLLHSRLTFYSSFIHFIRFASFFLSHLRIVYCCLSRDSSRAMRPQLSPIISFELAFVYIAFTRLMFGTWHVAFMQIYDAQAARISVKLKFMYNPEAWSFDLLKCIFWFSQNTFWKIREKKVFMLESGRSMKMYVVNKSATIEH